MLRFRGVRKGLAAIREMGIHEVQRVEWLRNSSIEWLLSLIQQKARHWDFLATRAKVLY